MRVHRLTVLGAAAGAAALASALALRAPILLDDGAITLRYAERLATGHGFTYNDHERVLGASNPLLVLVLALIVRTGVDPVFASTALGIAAYSAAVAVATWLTGRAAGSFGATVTAAALLGDYVFRTQALAGLEIALAVVLGLAAVRRAAEGRDIAAGVLAGFALWNKLDAAALVLGVAAAMVIVRRRISGRFLTALSLTIAPWIAWATWYFGSPIPNSVAAKLEAGRARSFDPWWMLRVLAAPARLHTFIALPIACRRESGIEGESRRFTAIACAVWAAGHVMAYSTVDLGDRYSWYLGVPIAPLAVTTGIAAAAVAAARPAWIRAAALAVAGVALGTALVTWRDAWRVRGELRASEAFDADRRLAGVFLRVYAQPHEIVQSAFGWPAYESKLPFNDSEFLNSVTHRAPVAYAVESGVPVENGRPPEAPPGMIPLAVFDLAHQRFPHYTWFVVYGRPDSAIARSGIRALPSDVARRVLGDARFEPQRPAGSAPPVRWRYRGS